MGRWHMVTGRARGCLKAIMSVIAILVVLGIVAILFIYSGIYNVGATYPENTFTAWALSTTMDNSVKRHAKGIKVPSLDDPKMLQTGLSHYRELCAMCHGAPGVKIGEVGRGLNPDPPELTEAAKDWKPNELFWITKNGVRMTGMPAWGVTHTDQEIWDMVAFVRKLPSMTPAQYQAMSQKAPHIHE